MLNMVQFMQIRKKFCAGTTMAYGKNFVIQVNETMKNSKIGEKK